MNLIRRPLYLALGFVLLMTPLAHAGAVDVSWNDETGRFTYAFEVAKGKLMIDAGWLHHTDDGDVGHVGMQLLGGHAFGSEALTAGVGGKAFFIETAPEDGGAVGLGGFLRYRRRPQSRLGAGLELYHAPEVLTSSGFDDYLEVAAHVSYAVIPDALFYTGYRLVEAGLEGERDQRLDHRVHIGLRLEF